MTSIATDINALFAGHGTPHVEQKRSTYRKPDPAKKFAANVQQHIRDLADPTYLGGKPHDAFRRLEDGRIVACAPRYGTHRITVAAIEKRDFSDAESATAFFKQVAAVIETGCFADQLAAASSRQPRAND